MVLVYTHIIVNSKSEIRYICILEYITYLKCLWIGSIKANFGKIHPIDMPLCKMWYYYFPTNLCEKRKMLYYDPVISFLRTSSWWSCPGKETENRWWWTSGVATQMAWGEKVQRAIIVDYLKKIVGDITSIGQE